MNRVFRPRAPMQFLPAGRRGSALLAALCLAAVLAIALGSYLTVCLRSLQMSTRHLSSAHGVELAETGMEEALWALNKNDWSNGWTVAGTTATKTLGGFAYDNGITGSVRLTVTNYNGSLGAGVVRTVTATGTTAFADGTTSSRTLAATSAKAPLFLNALAATTGRVRLRVAGTVDSYDSRTDPDAASVGYSAILSSSATTTTAATVQLTNAQIKGYVATLSTGPSYSTSAKVVGPATPVATKIDSARLSTSPYQPIFEELAPTGTALFLPAGTATVGNAGDTTPAFYSTTDVDLSGTQVLTVEGPVVLNVTGSLAVSSSAKIVIAATGSLEIHLAGDLILNGNGVQNLTKRPKNFVIIAKADNYYDTLGMATNTPFHGVIYTPNNSLTITNSQTIYGAIVAKAVTFSASPVFHYDVSLRESVFAGIDTPYAISNWHEPVHP